MIVRDPEPEERLQYRLVGDPDLGTALPIFTMGSSTKMVLTSLLSTSNLSQIGASRWTHWLMASWDLPTRAQESATLSSNCSNTDRQTRSKEPAGGMSFHVPWTSLTWEEDGADWNNNAVERTLRPRAVIGKITYENQSDERAHAHAILMSIGETCGLRKGKFFDRATKYLGRSISKR